MRLLLTLGILFYLCGCDILTKDYEKIADKITARTAAKLKLEKDLFLIGTGGGMMDDIKLMGMYFNYYKPIDMQSARELLVYAVEEYLSSINSSEAVRPYLHNYPFTAKNIELVIYFYKPDRSFVELEKLSIIAANEGRVEYEINHSEKRILKTIHEETYEEALKIVSSKK